MARWMTCAVYGAWLAAMCHSAMADCPEDDILVTGITPPVTGAIDGAFGRRKHPLLNTQRAHDGVDYHRDLGTPIKAAAAGTIVQAAYRGEFGNEVVIRHAGGVRTAYNHIQRFAPGIRETACVAAGTVIGFVGNTGLSAEPHLHFEISIDGRPINPVGFLPRERRH